MKRASRKKSSNEHEKPQLLKEASCYIAFLDILGFKNLLDDSAFAAKLENIVDRLQSRAKFDGKRYPNLEYLAVSDTIIITAKRPISDILIGYPLIRKVGQVQTALLKLGFATRGAITLGPTLIYGGKLGRNIFGKAYVEAYQAERDMAIYPRVIVTASAGQAIEGDIMLSTYRPVETYLLRDNDGTLFVNQFANDLVAISNPSTAESQSRSIENCKKYARSIEAGLRDAAPREKMKWYWLQNQFISQFPNYDY